MQLLFSSGDLNKLEIFFFCISDFDPSRSSVSYHHKTVDFNPFSEFLMIETHKSLSSRGGSPRVGFV